MTYKLFVLPDQHCLQTALNRKAPQCEYSDTGMYPNAEEFGTILTLKWNLSPAACPKLPIAFNHWRVTADQTDRDDPWRIIPSWNFSGEEYQQAHWPMLTTMKLTSVAAAERIVRVIISRAITSETCHTHVAANPTGILRSNPVQSKNSCIPFSQHIHRFYCIATVENTQILDRSNWQYSKSGWKTALDDSFKCYYNSEVVRP